MFSLHVALPAFLKSWTDIFIIIYKNIFLFDPWIIQNHLTLENILVILSLISRLIVSVFESFDSC